jgi:hypothetical protein
MMDHPNIARVFDAGATEFVVPPSGGALGNAEDRLKAELRTGRPFFVMELVKGVPITEFSDARKLTPRQRLELFVPVCQAIQHAHQKGIIHRDLKPSNVLVALYDDRPVPKVIDFGVAKAAGGPLTDRTLMTGFGAVVGTPEYMSPEQASLNNLDIDTRSDVYSLGVLLYELLTGSTPVDRKSLGKAALLEILRIVREVEATRPSVKLSAIDTLANVAANRGTEPAKLSKLMKGELDWLVLKALEKDRSQRYETANGLARDIQRYLADEMVEARPPSTGYRLKKFARRHRPQVLAASLVLLALLAGIVGTTLGLVRANRSAQAERIAKDDAVEQKALAEQAAEQERQAKVREAERAEGESQAKLVADAKRREAERNLAFAKKGNEILGSVFAGLDPKEIAKSGRPLQDVLRRNLSKAVKELEGSAIGDPLEVAAMQNTLGESLLALGEAALAVQVFQKALDTRKATLGPDHPQTLTSMNNLAEAYRYNGQLTRSVPLFEETLRKRKATLGPDHPHTLISMNNLAGAYRASGQLARAVPLYEETLEKRKAKLGPDHTDTLSSMNNLAGAYMAYAQLAKAVPLYEQTLQKRKTTLGPDHPHTLQSMNNLAEAYRVGRQPARAVALHEETLEKMKATLGADHPDTLNSMNNLALAYHASRQLAKAVLLHEETLQKRKATLGPDHPDTLNSMNNLAGAYWASDQLARAVPLFEETLEKRKATLGADHPDTLQSMQNLAGAYRDNDQLARAVPLFEETLQKRKATLGPDHPETLTSMNNLAGAYKASGQLARAVQLYEETLEKSKATLGPDHPQTLASMNNLAVAYQASGKLAKAVPLLVEALEKRKATLGPDHPDTLTTMNNLAAAYRVNGQLARAMPLFEETLEKRKVTLGPDHPDTLGSMGNLGKAYADAKQGAKAATTLVAFVDGSRKRAPKDNPRFAGLLAQVSLDLIRCGQHVAAEPLLRECLAIREKTQPDQWTTFQAMSLLGGALLGQKKYADAEPLLLKGYQGMKKGEKSIPPQGKIRLPEALNRLIELYTATNKPDEVKKWQAERAKYPASSPILREKK